MLRFKYMYILKGLTESDDWRDLGKFSVADSLRYGKAGNGDAGKKIVFE